MSNLIKTFVLTVSVVAGLVGISWLTPTAEAAVN